MRKIYVLFFISLLLVSFVSSQLDSLQDLEEELEEKIPKDQETAKEVASEYLLQEWPKIFEKNVFGRIILSIDDVLKISSPAFELVIGVPYALSWLFFLSLFAWIIVFIILFWAIRPVVQDITIVIVVSAIIPMLAAQLGTFEKIVLLFVPLFTNPGIIFTFILIVIILLYVYVIFMKKFKLSLEKQRKASIGARRERKLKLVEKIHDIKLKTYNKDL